MQQTTNKRNVTIALMIATFLSAIEGMIVSTAMPKIVSDLGGLKLISWVASVYLLTTAVSTPIFGKIADLFGRKVVFVLGALIFLLGSMLSGVAQTMGQLILFRAIQGLGAGAIVPVTFTIIGDIYPFEQRAKIQGLISGIWGISGILGPLTGGLLVDYVSWRWIFYMNLPFGIVSIVMLWFSLYETFEKKKKHIDYWGILTFTVSMTSLLYALLNAGTTYPWGSLTVIGLISLSLVLLIVFMFIEKKSPEPMLPLNLFSIRMITVSNISGFLLSAILVAINFYLPLWIQGIYGKGATESGLALIPMSVTWPLAAAVCGRMLVKMGIRFSSLLGTLIVMAGCAGLMFIHLETPHWVLWLLMGIEGFGFGIVFTSLTVSVQSAVEWNVRGVAMASHTFIRTMGQTIGIAVFGTMLNTGIASYLQKHADGVNAGKIDINNMLNPETIRSFPAHVMQLVREALAYGLHHIFFILAFIAAASFLFAIWLPKKSAETAEAPTQKTA